MQPPEGLPGWCPEGMDRMLALGCGPTFTSQGNGEHSLACLWEATHRVSQDLGPAVADGMSDTGMNCRQDGTTQNSVGKSLHQSKFHPI